MFGISFQELFIVLIIAVLFLKPEDYPEIIRSFRNFYRKLLIIKDNFQKEMDLLLEQDERAKFKEKQSSKTRFIVDMEGNLKEAYDIEELELIRSLKTKAIVENHDEKTIN